MNIIQQSAGSIGTAVMSAILTNQYLSKPAVVLTQAAQDDPAEAGKLTPDILAQVPGQMTDSFAVTYLVALILIALCLIPALFLPRRATDTADAAAPADPADLTGPPVRRTLRPATAPALLRRSTDRKPSSFMIEVHNLSKRYGQTLAVDGLDFTVHPGTVTGFLGPNGAGKSTTMRMIMGLDRPTTGSALVNGKPMTAHRAPLHQAGALLEAKGVHPGRSARNHLMSLAATTGIGAKRVDEVLELVGLSEVAGKRAGTFSLGMGQRLGIAAALLGDPDVVILDEPVNGLDPEGVRWIRYLLRDLAAEGRTVFVSSHLMNEMAVTAQHLIIVGKGKLIADVSLADFTAQATRNSVLVKVDDRVALTTALRADGVQIGDGDDDTLQVTGLTARQIGEKAFAAGIPVHELTSQHASLEEAFMAITGDSVEYHGGTVEYHAGTVVHADQPDEGNAA